MDTLFPHFSQISQIGMGGFGTVYSARNSEGKPVAIKKLPNVFVQDMIARRALRELKLLRHFKGHDNIIRLLDVRIEGTGSFQNIFIVLDLMQTDLDKIIRSSQPLTDRHIQYFMYQIFRGLKYIHSAGVLHRDLKPGNLLVNEDCTLKICDFGMARDVGKGISLLQPKNFMTEYVATRWYRAPEIMLSFGDYDKSIDMWSAGCILAEMLARRPLFPGRDYLNQMYLIFSIMGTPSVEYLNSISNEKVRQYFLGFPKIFKTPFSQLFSGANVEAADLIERLMRWKPTERLTVEQALRHGYVRSFHEPAEEPVAPAFQFNFERLAENPEFLRDLIMDEVSHYNAKAESNERWFKREAVMNPAKRSDASAQFATSSSNNNSNNDNDNNNKSSGDAAPDSQEVIGFVVEPPTTTYVTGESANTVVIDATTGASVSDGAERHVILEASPNTIMRAVAEVLAEAELASMDQSSDSNDGGGHVEPVGINPAASSLPADKMIVTTSAEIENENEDEDEDEQEVKFSMEIVSPGDLDAMHDSLQYQLQHAPVDDAASAVIAAPTVTEQGAEIVVNMGDDMLGTASLKAGVSYMTLEQVLADFSEQPASGNSISISGNGNGSGGIGTMGDGMNAGSSVTMNDLNSYVVSYTTTPNVYGDDLQAIEKMLEFGDVPLNQF